MALTLLSVVFVMVLSLHASVGFNLSGTAKFLKQIQAEFLVNAGLEKAFWQIRNEPSFMANVGSGKEQTLLFGEPKGKVSYKMEVFHNPDDLLKNKVISSDVYEKIRPWIKSESEIFIVKSSAYLGKAKEPGVGLEGLSIITKSNSGVKVVFKRINNG